MHIYPSPSQKLPANQQATTRPSSAELSKSDVADLGKLLKAMPVAEKSVPVASTLPSQGATPAEPITAVATSAGVMQKPTPSMPKHKGKKLAAKVGVGGITIGGILAFAGYGMYAAAPHIAAVAGAAVAAHVTVPILITIGAVLAAVAVGTLIRAGYRKWQKHQLNKANLLEIKNEARAAPVVSLATGSPVSDAVVFDASYAELGKQQKLQKLDELKKQCKSYEILVGEWQAYCDLQTTPKLTDEQAADYQKVKNLLKNCEADISYLENSLG